MRNAMQRLRTLTEALDNLDPSQEEEREKIQEEIWELEEEMEFNDEHEYRMNHNKKYIE